MSPVCHRALAYAVADSGVECQNVPYCGMPYCRILRDCSCCTGCSGESRSVSEKDYTRALFTAGGIGEVIAEKAMIAGAVGMSGGMRISSGYGCGGCR